VNQLARGNKREINALLRSGERLREAQRKAGRGGGDKLRAAIAKEREQVGKLAELAAPLLGSRREAKLDRVRAALHAAATDEATREAIAAGRLVEDKEAIGLGPLGGEATATATATEEGARRRRDAGAARREKSARREVERARLELGRLRDQAQEVAKALKGAERSVKEAEDRLAAAERAASTSS
jgi:hypothetical protein